MADRRAVTCVMCTRTIKIKLLANHLSNVHRVEADNLENFCKLQLFGYKTLTKVLKKKQNKKSSKKQLKVAKNISEKGRLQSKFERSIREQFFSMDVFSKMLMDVSREYHESRVTGGDMDDDVINRSLEAAKLEDSTEGEHNTSSGTLNFRINLKEQRMTQAPLNKSMEESIIKTPLISSKIQKLTKTKKPKMTTSTPKPRKVTKKTARSTGA